MSLRMTPKKLNKLEKHEVNDETKADFEKVKEILRKRLRSFDAEFPLRGMDAYKKEIFDLVSRTVTTGESNSLLLTGPRGSGKSALVRQILEDVKRQPFADDLIVIRLNGLLQTDDQIAIEEITRQLQLENVIGDKVFGSFADKLRFLLEALKSGSSCSSKSKSLVFILDEFDLFCKRRNQHLLYNLFNVVQSSQTAVLVLGLTCSLDAIEMLEKRVKSRFSHRQIQIFPCSLFPDYLQVVKDYLLLAVPCKDLKDRNYALEWNFQVENIVGERKVHRTLQKMHDISADYSTLKSFLTILLSGMDGTNRFPVSADFTRAESIMFADSTMNILQGLSILELCLLVAMKKLRDNYDGQAFNFEMIYKEYVKMSRQHVTVMTHERGMVMKAFEHLKNLQLIKPEGAASSCSVPEQFRLVSMSIEDSALKETLQKYPELPTEIQQWAHSSF